MSWLFDTLVWTGALIALVLVLRRPVAREFGAQAAYALWALPLLRLLLPPIVLPAWLAPAKEVAASPLTATFVDAGAETAGVYVPTSATVTDAPTFDVTTLAGGLWLAGACVYVTVRLVAYARLRAELLAGSRPVGEMGRIRLIETPATASPLAFGLIDKVIALPPGFMAQSTRAARDLALEHEFAHHRAHDLAANFAALGLFALHWFNPLSWLGWRAMRRDQEAACDARVVGHRNRVDRALYATVIAGAAAAPRTALAAPMACPVLGDKSIIHRLRTLTMNEHSIRRRRAGLLLVGAAALALPLTASISYAADSDPAPPAPPAPPEAPLAPTAPLAPAAPDAPLAPDAPAMETGDSRVVVEQTSPDGKKHERRVMIFRSGNGEHLAHAPGAPEVRVRKIVRRGPDGKIVEMDGKELEKHIEAITAEAMAAARAAPRAMVIDERRIASATARAATATAMAERMAARAPRVIESCDGNEQVSESDTPDGKRVIRICSARIEAHALGGLRSARSAIARNTDMSASVRAEVLADLDREIARLEAGK